MAESFLTLLEAGHALTRAQAEALMGEILAGRVETPDLVRVLQALNRRAVEVGELAGFASVMRRHAATVFPAGEIPENLVDTCGTGGKGASTFNISTAAAIVAASAGARVAKHGNRAMSSASGSADVLEALGVAIDLPVERFGQAIREIGIGFLYAPAAHQATRHATPARKQLRVRTVFNLLGPLTNPAGAEAQVLGVPSADLLDRMAAALVELGVRRALVVHGMDGLDEISTSGPTLVREVKDGTIRSYTVGPEDFGVDRASLADVAGGTPADNARLIRGIFEGAEGPPRDIVLANAAAALVVSGVAGEFLEGVELARQAIAQGRARDTLERLRKFTNS